MKAWLALVGSLAFGCQSEGGGSIGSVCGSDDECGEGLECGTSSWARGLCTRSCGLPVDCGSATAFACPDNTCVPKCLLPSDCETNRCTSGAVCASGHTGPYDRCSADADCPSGMTCDKIADLTYRFCTTTCETAADCPAGGSCDVTDTKLCW